MLKIGHRGASAHVPENTLTAFHKAIALGADGVELDVHLCKTGELVVIHDDTVDRTTNGKGLVAEMTLNTLRALEIKGDEHIPTLNEVLDALSGAYFFIEIKHGDAALAVAREIEQRIQKGWPADRLWLISFQHAALQEALAQFPTLHIGMSYENLTPTAVQDAQTAGARALIPHHQRFNETLIKKAHASGLKVVAWTVNDAQDIEGLKAIGVDGIMSDYPERL